MRMSYSLHIFHPVPDFLVLLENPLPLFIIYNLLKKFKKGKSFLQKFLNNDDKNVEVLSFQRAKQVLDKKKNS